MVGRYNHKTEFTIVIPHNAMYATTYDIDLGNDGDLLLELVLVDDIIFHCYGDDEWYAFYSCTLEDIRCVSALNLGSILDLKRYGTVYDIANNCELIPSALCSILNTIRTVYRFPAEEHTFKRHSLDSRWDDISNRIRNELW
jgi:hypothetical protein